MATRKKSEKYIYSNLVIPKPDPATLWQENWVRDTFAEMEVYYPKYNCEIWGLKWTISYHYECSQQRTISNRGEKLNIDNSGPIITSWVLGLPSYMTDEEWENKDMFNNMPVIWNSKKTIVANYHFLKSACNNARPFATGTSTSDVIKGSAAGLISLTQATDVQSGDIVGDNSLNIDCESTPAVRENIPVRAYTTYDVTGPEGSLGNGNEIWDLYVEKGHTQTKRELLVDEPMKLRFHMRSYQGLISVRLQFFVTQKD